ncbi:hypothetical protein [Maribacter sp. IgM3_T14_3]|uniref:hypothetical protein n=1 Tax=Maribacter sp. IgM3_T14_3 TaxID=3415140 RepID=UPI003C6EC6F2
MIQEYENLIRHIILSVLGNQDTADFGVSDERIQKWKENRQTEEKKHGILVENRLIYYSEFYDLKNIIVKKWERFKEILVDKKKFEVHFNQMMTFRNTYSHGRFIFSHQNKLIEGILGETKALLVQYHNKNADMNDYFVRILSISDSLGNSWTPDDPNPSGMTTKSIMRVGDKVNIKIEAFDPREEDIKYQLQSPDFDSSNITGEFEFIPTKEMISRRYGLTVIVSTVEKEYKNQDQRAIQYVIIPEV